MRWKRILGIVFKFIFSSFTSKECHKQTKRNYFWNEQILEEKNARNAQKALICSLRYKM